MKVRWSKSRGQRREEVCCVLSSRKLARLGSSSVVAPACLALERRARPWPPELRYYQRDLWERRRQVSRSPCLSKPRHTDLVDLLCPVRRRPLQLHSRCHRAPLLVRQPPPLCHREPSQLPARDGLSLLPSSQRTGEPTSGPVWCIALPNLRSLLPAIERKDSTSSLFHCSANWGSNQPPKPPHAQVSMVLTVSELRGCRGLLTRTSVLRVWIRWSAPRKRDVLGRHLSSSLQCL